MHKHARGGSRLVDAYRQWHGRLPLLTVPLLTCVVLLGSQPTLASNSFAVFETHIGPRESMLIADSNRRVLFSKNEQQQLIPASILKVLTALAALHYLGPDFRFQTEFYLDENSNLKVKGYGDPLLISEVITEISVQLGDQHAACQCPIGSHATQIMDAVA